MEIAIVLELILGTLYGLIALYACLKMALVIRPSRKKGWRKAGACFMVGALLFGAVMSGYVLLEVILYIT